jgi:hypothetical protein
MAMTKVEAAKLTQDMMLRGVIETIVTESMILVTCPPKTGPATMRVLDGNWSRGGQHAREPVYAGADRWRTEGA